MKRSDFLKGAGILGIGSLLPMRGMADTGTQAGKNTASCTLIPSETAGPYPWPTSGNGFDATLIKQNLNVDASAPSSLLVGVPLAVTLTFVNTNNNCEALDNIYVSVWHCNYNGNYSKYSSTQNGGDFTEYSFFRGVQITDSNGQVTFNTIVPGWYIPRAVHIHMQAFLNSVLNATSQLAFPDAFVNGIYTNNSSIYTKGATSYLLANDQVFGDGNGNVATETQYEIMDISPADYTSGSYTASITVGISVPTTGVINLEVESGGQFKMGNNYPNPFDNTTTFPFSLISESQVLLELYDLEGRKLATIADATMAAGDHNVTFSRASLHLPAGNYVYQLAVTNSNGTFKKCKLLTVK